ncbi:MAG: NAD(P)-dependent oxidoreductase, partial [Weissella cibaria]
FDTTIVSPVMFHGGPAGKPIIFDSHETTPAQTVSRETIALVYLEALLQDKWRNQMITVGDRK